MRPANEYHDSRRMLIHLLTQDGDGPIDENYSDGEREFMRATCAANVLLYHICFMAGFDEETALKGIKALEIERHVREICTL